MLLITPLHIFFQLLLKYSPMVIKRYREQGKMFPATPGSKRIPQPLRLRWLKAIT